MRYISHLLILLVLVMSPLVTGCGGQMSEEEAERLEEGDDSGEFAEEGSGEESGDEEG